MYFIYTRMNETNKMETCLTSSQRIFYSILVVFTLIGCGNLEERVRDSHPNGLRKTVHVYSGDEWVGLKTFHMNNIRETSTEIQDQQKHGQFKRWSTQGTLVEEGEYQEGLRSGLWTQYLSRTEKVSQGRYLQGKKDGLWQEFWPQGILKKESHWKQGQQVQTEKEWFYDGKIKSEHNCFNQGDYKEFYYNGQLKLHYSCSQGQVRQGFFKQYDLLGHLLVDGSYDEQSQKDSTWIWTNALGETQELRHYHSGLMHGRQQIFYPTLDSLVSFDFTEGSGTLSYPCTPEYLKKFSIPNSPCADTTWVEGKVHGVTTTWTPKGDLKEETWENGSKVWQDKYRYTPQGTKRKVSSGGFKNNLRSGPWFVWNSQGKLIQKLNFKEDLYHGDQLYYDSNEVLTMKKTFRGKNQEVIVEIIKK